MTPGNEELKSLTERLEDRAAMFRDENLAVAGDSATAELLSEAAAALSGLSQESAIQRQSPEGRGWKADLEAIAALRATDDPEYNRVALNAASGLARHTLAAFPGEATEGKAWRARAERIGSWNHNERSAHMAGWYAALSAVGGRT